MKIDKVFQIPTVFLEMCPFAQGIMAYSYNLLL